MDFFWHILAMIGMSLPNLLGFNLIFGKGKILHFGPIGVSIVSAYATFLTLQKTGSFLDAFIVGLVAALLLSAFFAWLSLRLEPDGLGVMSIAVHLAMLAVVLNWTSLTRGALGIPHIPRLPFLDSPAAFAVASLSVSGVWFFFLWWLDRGTFGRRLQALAEQEWYAESLGIDRAHVHFTAFLIGGVGAALVNFLYPQYLMLLHPSDFTFPFLIFFVTVVVAGKPGSVLGVVLATVLLTFLKEGLRLFPFPADILGPLRIILFGMILFAAVWWRRDNVFPAKREV